MGAAASGSVAVGVSLVIVPVQASSILTLGCSFAWRDLVMAEYREVGVQAAFLDDSGDAGDTGILERARKGR